MYLVFQISVTGYIGSAAFYADGKNIDAPTFINQAQDATENNVIC